MSAEAARVVVVTGGGRGIGRAVALAFAAEGARIGLVARTQSEIDETLSQVETNGGAGLAIAADVADREGVDRAHERIAAELGLVDILVNNAGVGGSIAPTWEADPEQWRRTVDVNLYGTFLWSRAVLPSMVERGAGRIVNVSSNAGAHRWPFVADYSVAKAGVIKFTENLAFETRRHGVAVFAMHPGTVNVGPTQALLQTDVPEGTLLARVKSWFEEQVEAGEDFPPEVAAELVTLLASGRADALSGRYISVEDDVEALIAAAEEIRKRDLQVLKLARLT
jgi:NAD(P)-dependent dehydrogenase (short-subunit alcohol dehydrogenase family)